METEFDADARRWARYLAKSIDLTVVGFPFVIFFSFIFGILLGLLFPEWMLDPTKALEQNFIFGALAIATQAILFPFIEAMLIKSYATTPGKALMGFRVTTETGGKLSTGTSLARAYRCYVFGLALGIPLVVIGTMIHQFGRVEEKGKTGWDEALNLTVHTKPVGVIRWFFGLLLGLVIPFAINAASHLMANSW